MKHRAMILENQARSIGIHTKSKEHLPYIHKDQYDIHLQSVKRIRHINQGFKQMHSKSIQNL